MKIEFNTDNDVFCDENGLPNDVNISIEISKIFNDISHKVLHRVHSGSIIDTNGNKIGEWSL
jgi:hypothetical protein